MSTTFAVKVKDKKVEIARRRGIGSGKVAIIWLNELVDILPDEMKVHAMDNTAQGVSTMKDLRHLHEHGTFNK